LTFFNYRGHSAFLNTLVAGFSAPTLRNFDILLFDTSPPLLHLSRFIEDIGEHFHAVKVSLSRDYFHLLLFSHPEGVNNNYWPRIKLRSRRVLGSMMQISSALSANLATMQELFVVFSETSDASEQDIPWRRFLSQFPSVKALRMEGTNDLRIASALHEDLGVHNGAFLPALEEIELRTNPFRILQDQTTSGDMVLAAFEPFVSARQQAGRPVRVSRGSSLRDPWKFPGNSI
jgi:hypothetical protein